MRFSFQGSVHEFRELICKVLGCSAQHKPKVRFWLLTTEADEPIPKEQTTMKLTKPIKPGFRRPFTITPDEPVDVRSDGSFFAAEIISGDSTVTINPASTATSLKGYLNGDGSTGDKSVRLVADGHLGDGDLPVSLDIEFAVQTPDATSISAFVEGVDEPIPVA